MHFKLCSYEMVNCTFLSIFHVFIYLFKIDADVVLDKVKIQFQHLRNQGQPFGFTIDTSLSIQQLHVMLIEDIFEEEVENGDELTLYSMDGHLLAMDQKLSQYIKVNHMIIKWELTKVNEN